MKQVLIGINKWCDDNTVMNDLTQLEAGQIGFFDLVTKKELSNQGTIKNNFMIAVGRGTVTSPLVIPEVDYKTLTVTKAAHKDKVTGVRTLTVPTPVIGTTYTVILVKLGTKFNEKNKWTASCMAKTTTVADVLNDLVKQLTAMSPEDVEIEATSTGIQITTDAQYDLLGADGLTSAQVTGTFAVPAVGDYAYVMDLAQRCAAGKGFNYLAEDGKEIYPGYPEKLNNDEFDIYTFRFAVPRASAKQRDEVVYQLVHLVVDTGSDVVQELDTLISDFLVNVDESAQS